MKVKTYSLKVRSSKVEVSSFAYPPARKSSFLKFYKSLPRILKGNDIREVVSAVVGARKKKRSAIWMAGAHVIKCGLNPVLIELMRVKAMTCLCLNGAGLIHDFEIAFQGTTSEDVGRICCAARSGWRARQLNSSTRLLKKASRMVWDWEFPGQKDLPGRPAF